MKNGLKIFTFVLGVLLFYSYVGQTVPQKITYPPESMDLSGDMTTAELVTVGEEIVAEKGTCLGCHTVGSQASGLRFPDLGGIGGAASTRIEGMSDVEYLAQSLYDPDTYIVDGFHPGMPAINRPPIGLTRQEILAVIAYLQSLGGEPSVTLQTVLSYHSESAATVPVVADGTGGSAAAALFTTYLCTTCHVIDSPARGVGPSLYDVGARLSPAQIRESILDPDATITEGYAPGVMKATLDAIGFYDKVTDEELVSFIDFLTSLGGE